MERDPRELFIEKVFTEHGWTVQLIPEDDEGPGFAYTVGLHRRFAHAEIIIVGLRPEVMHDMLNACGERLRGGEKLPIETPFLGLLEGNYSTFLRPVRTEHSYREHVGYAAWFNDTWQFPLLQLVYPDKQGRFPGEPGVSEAFLAQQPLLP